MARREFPVAVRRAVLLRCRNPINKQIYCEGCSEPVKGKFQIDHIIPDALDGEPVLSNAQLLCEGCFSIKNPKDTTDAAKSKRREGKELRIIRPKGNMRGQQFAGPAPKVRSDRICSIKKSPSHLPRRICGQIVEGN